MQLAGFHHLVELALQPDHLIVNRAAVGLDLGFPRATNKAKATTLAFKVGPGADEAGALIRQRGEFHLQHAFAGAGAVGENLQDQTGSVQKLDAPFLFQISLLNRGHRTIDQHQINLQSLQPGRHLIHLTGAEQHSGM